MLDLKSNFSSEEAFDFSSEIQSIKSLNNRALLVQIRQAAKAEQNLTLQVIELIAEVDRRKLYLDSGYGSIFDFVTKDLGYEPTSAMRRIQAARAISEIPELKEKIADGSLNLSVVSQAQSFLRKKANDQKQKISLKEKTELYQKLENKSAREAERELFKIAPELCLKSMELEKALSENLTELRFVIDADTKTKMDELKLWLSHQNPDMTQAQFYKVMVEKLHRQLDQSKPGKRLRKKSENASEKQSEATSENKSLKPQIDFNQSIADAGTGNPYKETFDVGAVTASSDRKKRSRHIPTAIKNLVWNRDQGCCQFIDPQSKKNCGSKYQIQLDHIQPFRHLGDHSVENLRLLCGKHNRRRD